MGTESVGGKVRHPWVHDSIRRLPGEICVGNETSIKAISRQSAKSSQRCIAMRMSFGTEWGECTFVEGDALLSQSRITGVVGNGANQDHCEAYCGVCRLLDEIREQSRHR
jgi:hypothetical protein